MDYVWYITPEQYDKAAKNGIDRNNLNKRVRDYGWDIERATTEPIKKRFFRLDEGMVKQARENGINRKALYSRLRIGMDPEKAVTMPIMTMAEVTRKSIEDRRKYKPELMALALKNGMTSETYRNRVRNGMDEVEAATRPPMTKAEAGRIKKKRSG